MSAAHITPYAGSWYPANRSELEQLLEAKFAESQRRTGPFLRPGIGFVTPHAGPEYSGTTSAAVYRTLREQQPEQVIVLAFPHRGWLQGVVTPDVQAIETPLGEVPIDRGFLREFRAVRESQVCDHSFEIQLPFLQMSAPAARVTPLYVGELTARERAAAAEVLAGAWRPGVVFVASSDFTHYGSRFGHVPFPSDRDLPVRLRELDFEYMEAAGSLDSTLFLETLREHQGTVCGAGPIALLLETLRCLGGQRFYCEMLDYQTSGELTQDWEQSVSYAALAFSDRKAFELDAEDREALLESAAATLHGLREDGNREGVPATRGSLALTARQGVFVSLHRGAELLGCIGNLHGTLPLAENVARLVVSAALEDPRFGPAALAPGPVDIEISVLSPFRRIRSAHELTIGRHGAMLTSGRPLGLLLPQVAEGREWTSEDFLNAVARKSNRPSGAWRDPRARVSVFEAQVFERKG